MLNYMGSTVKGLINLFRLYCMVDVANIDILKLCKIHLDLICPDKIWSIIILVIILKCNDQISLSIAIESDFKHDFYGFTLTSLKNLLVLQDLWKRLSKIKQINKFCY